MTLTLFAELLVASLLVATIVTCYLLQRRIERLKADEVAMRQTVTALVAATDTAERAIASLRSTLGDCDRGLAERLLTAERYAADLAAQIDAGQAVMERIARIVSAASAVAPAPAPAPAAPEPPAVLARIASAAEAAAAIRARAARRLEEQAA